MAQKTYILTQNYKTPYVRITGLASNPQEVRWKGFKKGTMIKGELKHANNKPAFVLVEGTLVFPLEVLREVTTKVIDVNSGFDGKAEAQVGETKIKIASSSKPKIRVTDAAIAGAIVGALGVYLAEKQGWIAVPDKKNKIYGAVIGAALFGYIIHRRNSK